MCSRDAVAVHGRVCAAGGATRAWCRHHSGGQITVTGCIQREADYRQAKDAGKGGVAGTGVGAGNEFILSNATVKPGTDAGPVGTSGAAPAAYELTGSGEGQAAEFVGKRVEITLQAEGR